jgi:hypothetical protein
MKKSVLFVCADQRRWDCFSFMKHKNAVTPNLDELAKKSTIFKSHFAGILHRDRQLSSLYISKDGISSNYGPPSRKLTN